MSDIKRRPIRSYVLRQGRITRSQQQALETLWPGYGIDYSNDVIDPASVFGNTAPVTLEIGFGDGNTLLQQAQQQPDNNFIGVEVHRPGVGQLLHRVHQAGLKNVRVINHDAAEVINHQFTQNSLARVQLFFPDPWHKKRHHKRRILQPAFVSAIHRILDDGGLFHIATDWQDYAEYCLDVMDKHPGFENCAGNGRYSNRGDRPLTRFEQRGRKLGHEVYDLRFIKK